MIHMHLVCDGQALSIKESTTTPLWKGLWVMLKYRTRNNYVWHAPAHNMLGVYVRKAFAFYAIMYMISVEHTSSIRVAMLCSSQHLLAA